MPGYLLVNMNLTDDSWGLVKNTPGVTGFVGASQKPVPLSQVEIDRLLNRETAERPRTRAQFSIGESVKVVSGPALGLLRRDLRDQRRCCQAQGAGIHLRPRDPGRGRLRPGQENLMAKKVLTLIKLQVPGGAANPAPPVGPALGQHGVNIMEFCKAFNAQTQGENGTIIPVEITVFEDRSFTFITKTPPAAVLIKQAIGLEKGSGEPNRNKVGTITRAQVRADRGAQDAGPERQRPRPGLQDHRGHRALDGRRGGIAMATRQALPRQPREGRPRGAVRARARRWR